jgi:hypothetical protein
MPALRVTKNGRHLCTVGSEDVWMFSASVWGNIWGPEASFLDIHGSGKLGPKGESEFLIWEMPHVLKLQDTICFSFEDGLVSLPKGKVFAPDPASDKDKVDFSSPPSEADVARFESRPKQNTTLIWRFSRDGGAGEIVAPDASRQHVSFGLLWNADRPNRLRASLSKSSLREIISRTEGTEIFLDYVPLGSRFEIAVGV